MATNPFFNHRYKPTQLLYEDLIIEALQFSGEDVYYIPRDVIRSDEIMNEEYSRFSNAYTIEMYPTNVDGFEGEGDILTKFGLEIRDQATFIVSKRRFEQLVDTDQNSIREYRPREGDLIYLPMSKSLFEIKFVEHEQPFYQLKDLPIYDIRCELYEYSSEKFNTGIGNLDTIQSQYASQIVIEIEGGTQGFSEGDLITQIQPDGTEVTGRVASFRYTDRESESAGFTGEMFLSQVSSNDGKSNPSFTEGLGIESSINPDNTGWIVSQPFDLRFGAENEPLSQNSDFQIKGDDIINFDENNPFGEPR